MRAIFFAMLLANLLYVGWAEWIDVPMPPPPSSIMGLRPLTLVKDLPPDKRAALASKKSLEAPPSECVSLGPFDDPAVAARAVAVLRAKSFAPQQRATESSAVRRFWVYLQDLSSDAAVTRVLHRLERAGIDDAEAMPPATGGRRISLGLFTQRDRAERRERAVAAMGFRPAMMERMLPGTVYWLDLTLPNGSTPVPLKDVSDLEPGGGSSAITVQPCASGPSPAVPSPQSQPPASSPVAPPAAIPQTASHAAPPVSAVSVPRCKPGGGGAVPCVTGPKAATLPSVL